MRRRHIRHFIASWTSCASADAGADEVVAEWSPQPHLQAFPDILCGGVIGTLLDCHSNWAGAWAIMGKTSAPKPPWVVTDEYSVKLLKPAPLDRPLHLTARAPGQREARRGRRVAACRW